MPIYKYRATGSVKARNSREAIEMVNLQLNAIAPEIIDDVEILDGPDDDEEEEENEDL